MMLKLILFEDDTNAFFAHRDPNHLIEILEFELNKLSNWFKANLLSLRQKQYLLDTQIRINNWINWTSDWNHLSWSNYRWTALTENSYFSWGKQNIKICSNHFKSSFYLFKSSLQILYLSLIYPYLQYCYIVWASAYPTNLRRLVLSRNA